jgi:hypothetical protein
MPAARTALLATRIILLSFLLVVSSSSASYEKDLTSNLDSSAGREDEKDGPSQGVPVGRAWAISQSQSDANQLDRRK